VPRFSKTEPRSTFEQIVVGYAQKRFGSN